MSRVKQFGIPVVLLLFGIGVGWFAHWDNDAITKPLRQSDLASTTQYAFIDPLIGLKTSDTSASPIYEPLQSAVQNVINAQISSGDLEAASVNFRDMSLSAGFVIDPDEQYAPASLFKIPTMMSYLKLAEKDPGLLSRTIYYAGANGNAQELLKSPVQLTPGRSYTIEELIEHMIKYSDNNAAQLLGDYLNSTGNEDAANNLVRDLGITQIEYGQDFITVRALTLFFRVLYNATYLSRDMSEKSLEIMSQTDFKTGLVAGVASSTPVAHKFGEFSLLNKQGLVLERELHDCGIIYYPDHPYLLCVMTKGGDFTQLENTITTVSKLVYADVNTKYGK